MANSEKSEKNNILGKSPWFGDSIHYWTNESLKFAYAFACVDIAIKKSARAKQLYNSIDPIFRIVFEHKIIRVKNFIPYIGRKVTANTCQAKADLATRLKKM